MLVIIVNGATYASTKNVMTIRQPCVSSSIPQYLYVLYALVLVQVLDYLPPQYLYTCCTHMYWY